MRQVYIKIPGQVAPVGINPDKVYANNVIFPHEFNVHKVGLWVIGNEYGALAAIWASNAQDLLDEAADLGLLDNGAIEEREADDESARLGNDSAPYNLDFVWVREVADLKKLDLELLLKFAEARGATADTIDL